MVMLIYIYIYVQEARLAASNDAHLRSSGIKPCPPNASVACQYIYTRLSPYICLCGICNNCAKEGEPGDEASIKCSKWESG